MINIVICEDSEEQLFTNERIIGSLCNKFNVTANIKGYLNGDIEKEVMKDAAIAFLDIDLVNESGLDIASRILECNEWCVIIFVTSYAEYALDAYGIQALGYILKPLNQRIAELERVFQRALAQVAKLRESSLWLSFYCDRKRVDLLQEEIMYIEKIRRKIEIVTFIKSFYINTTIQALHDKLSNDFIRINQGIIVNINEVACIERNTVFLKSGIELRIGITYAESTKKYYQRFLEGKGRK